MEKSNIPTGVFTMVSGCKETDMEEENTTIVKEDTFMKDNGETIKETVLEQLALQHG